jgi:hypothetical protein
VSLVAAARVLAGDHAGKSLRVWPAGQMRGDLGEPRLNQRAALYAESILDKARARRPERHRKTFDGPGGAIEIEFDFHEEDLP